MASDSSWSTKRQDPVKIYDFDQWLIEWPKVSKHLKKENRRAEYDWSRVEFVWQKPKYDSKSPPDPVTTSSQIFSCTVSNNTLVDQTHRVKSIKKVHGYSNVALYSAIKKEGEVNASLRTPPYVSATGFPSVLNVRNEVHSESSEEVECHIDTPVTVEPGKTVTVTVEAVEKMFVSTFSVQVRIRGKVFVRIYNGDLYETTVEGNLRQITDDLIKDKSKLIDKAEDFGTGSKDIRIQLAGRCRFQYVQDQKVDISYAADDDQTADAADALSYRPPARAAYDPYDSDTE